MPNPALPSALNYVIGIATLPDASPIDLADFSVGAFEPVNTALHGKNRRIVLSPLAWSTYYGKISIYYDPIDLSAWEPLDWVIQAQGYAGDKLGLLDAISDYLGVVVEPSDIINDVIVLLEDEIIPRQYFVIEASPLALLWTGGLRILTRLGPPEAPFFIGTIDVQTTLLVSCDVNVTLVANVVGDLTGHTYEWDQVSGTPVYWLEDKHQLSAMFQQPAIRDDKVFRFYIDRGLATQIARDILVTSVATDTPKLSFGAIPSPMQTTVEVEQASSINFPPDFTAYGTAVVDNPARMLSWLSPSVNYYAYAEVINRDAGQVLGSATTAPYTRGIELGVYYRLDTYLDHTANFRSSSIDWLIYQGQNPVFPDVAATDRVCHTLGALASALEILQVVKLELISAATNDEMAPYAFGVIPSSLETLQVLNLELAGLDAGNETTPYAFGVLTSPMVVLEISSTTITSLG